MTWKELIENCKNCEITVSDNAIIYEYICFCKNGDVIIGSENDGVLVAVNRSYEVMQEAIMKLSEINERYNHE